MARGGRRLSSSVEFCQLRYQMILTKLGSRGRAQLVVIAYESGLAAPGA
jgi:hypothetical protein